MAEQQFGNIALCGQGKHSRGSFKTSDRGLRWVDRQDTSNVKQMNKGDIDAVEWSQLGHSAHLRVVFKAADSPALRFEGFKKQDKKNVKDFLSATCDVEMEDVRARGRDVPPCLAWCSWLSPLWLWVLVVA
jgi:hypothetical protein